VTVVITGNGIYNAGRGYWAKVALFENIYISASDHTEHPLLRLSIDAGYSWVQPSALPRRVEPMSAGWWSSLDMCRNGNDQPVYFTQYRKSNGQPGVMYQSRKFGPVVAVMLGGILPLLPFFNSYWTGFAISNDCSKYLLIEYKTATGLPGSIYILQLGSNSVLLPSLSAGKGYWKAIATSKRYHTRPSGP